MSDLSTVKERIMAAATALIENGSGDIAAITTRAIAKEAGVGASLVNYHFQSKDHLITLCVQRMIAQVVAGFKTDSPPSQTDRQRLTDWAARVFDFLFENASLSRISILGDLAAYTPDCNAVHTQLGFTLAMTGRTPPGDRDMLAFVLTAAMQVAFLAGDVGAERVGADFSTREGRRAWIARLTALLYGGAAPGLQ